MNNTENFAELFEQSFNETDFRVGALIKATVIDIQPGRVIVSAGLKSEGIISDSEFRNEQVAVGDQVDVVIDALENGFGETRLSHEKARRAAAWKKLQAAHDDNETIRGMIVERVKGGFTVELSDFVRAFLPGSLVDIKPVRDTAYLEGKEHDFKIIKMDQQRNNIVVSRRAVIEEETGGGEREARLEQLQEGQEVMGIVKNITDYGAFVDLGGVDGLLHITDMSWKRVKHPSEVVKVGDEVRVKVLKFERDKNRVSLGLKQLSDDPWHNIERRYPVGTRLFGKVTNIADYGCFIQIEEGVEGLVHMSEIDWTNKNVHPGKIVKTGDEAEVMVLDIDEDRRRISLGIKQCKANPWQEFSDKFNTGQKMSGKIRSITDFGLFIGLDGNIDGLVHVSDISWSEPGEQAIRNYKKGDEVEAVILAIDPERERISLGIKQLSDDPLADFFAAHKKGDVLTAKVVEVSAKQASLQLAENVLAQLRAQDYSHEKTMDLSGELKAGEELKVKLTTLDSETRQIHVSHKALVESAEKSTAEVPSNTTLGDLLKEQMKKKEDEK